MRRVGKGGGRGGGRGAVVFVPRVLRPRPNPHYNLRALPASDTDCSANMSVEEEDTTQDLAVVRTQTFGDVDGRTWANIFSFLNASEYAVASKICKMARTYGCRAVQSFAPTPFVRRAWSSGTFASLVAHFPLLRVLSFNECKAFNDDDAAAIALSTVLSNVRVLDLTQTSVTGTGLAVIAQRISTLHELRLSHVLNASDAEVALMAAKSPNLRWLDLSATGISDEGVQAVAAHCQSIKFLDLSYCNASDSSMLELARRSTCLETLRIPAKMTSDGLVQMSELQRGLKSLGLVRSNISDAGLVATIRNMFKLTSLHLAHVVTLTDAGLIGISTLMPNLTTLNLRSLSDFVTDVGIIHIVRRCMTLKTLRLRSLNAVTDVCLESVAFNMLDRPRKQSLKSIEVHSMQHVSGGVLIRFLKTVKTVEGVSAVNCPNVFDIQMGELAFEAYNNRMLREEQDRQDRLTFERDREIAAQVVAAIQAQRLDGDAMRAIREILVGNRVVDVAVLDAAIENLDAANPLILQLLNAAQHEGGRIRAVFELLAENFGLAPRRAPGQPAPVGPPQ